MQKHLPAVMVSSTFFDLRQLRADLAEFLQDELGYRTLLSEFPSFPVDPDADTIENCRRRVEHDADVLVLIIGGRFGYVDQASAKSVTNLEYLAARAKGIPIFAFVEKSVLTLLPMWEKNPDADFSHAVADVRVFDFIRQVRTVDRVWMHEFELAREVISTLRTQFAYLMSEGLSFRLRLTQRPDRVLSQLHGQALRIALEQPAAWEYKLFGQVLADEIEDASDLRRSQQLGLAFGIGSYVPKQQASEWVETRLHELRQYGEALTTLMNESLKAAFGPDGEPGDPEAIVFVARNIAAIYRHAIEWSQRVRSTHHDPCFAPVAVELSRFTEDMLEKLSEFGRTTLEEIDAALSAPPTGTRREIRRTLVLDISNDKQFQAALQQAERDCF